MKTLKTKLGLYICPELSIIKSEWINAICSASNVDFTEGEYAGNESWTI